MKVTIFFIITVIAISYALSLSTIAKKENFKGCFYSQTDYVEFFKDGSFSQFYFEGEKYNEGSWRLYIVDSEGRSDLAGVLYGFLSKSVFVRGEKDFQAYRNLYGNIYFELPSDYRDSNPTRYEQTSCDDLVIKMQ